MVELRDAMSFMLQHHPAGAGELSEAMLLRLLYLADWGHAMVHKQALTNVRWRRTGFGAHADCVFNAAKNRPDAFEVHPTGFQFGSPRHIIRRSFREIPSKIPPEGRFMLGFVLEIYGRLSWDVLAMTIAETYPVESAVMGEMIDVRLQCPEIIRDYPDVVALERPIRQLTCRPRDDISPGPDASEQLHLQRNVA